MCLRPLEPIAELRFRRWVRLRPPRPNAPELVGSDELEAMAATALAAAGLRPAASLLALVHGEGKRPVLLTPSTPPIPLGQNS